MSRYASRTDGLAFVPVRDGYVVDGGARQEHVTGRLARELFPALLPLLDGTRTVEEIAGVLGLPLPYVREVVARLAERDLVRLHAASTPQHRSPPMRVFLRRSYPGADGIWQRLRTSSVAVSCGRPLTGLVSGLLRQSGVGPLGHGAGTPDLAVGVPANHAAPVLPVRVTATAVSIGPLVRPDDAAGHGAESGECDPVLAGVAAGVIAGIVVRVLGGHGERHAEERIVDVLHAEGRIRVVERTASAPAGPAPDSPTPAGPAPGGPVLGAACRHAARHHLTERRVPLRRGARPLVRAMSRIAGGLPLVPAAGHAGAVRAYLLADLDGGPRRYAVDPVAGELVELPGAAGQAGDLPALVLAHDPCVRERLLPGDTGLMLAQLADDAHTAGWRVRAAVPRVPPDLGAGGGRAAVVAELAPVRPRARPAGRARPAAGCHPGDEPLDGARLARVISRALARVEETWEHGHLRCVAYARNIRNTAPGTAWWTGEPDRRRDAALPALEGQLADRGLSPAALLLFTAHATDARTRMEAAMAAATVRLLAARAGMGATLVAGLPEDLSLGRSVLYGCALGSPSTGPPDRFPDLVVW
ncbi:DUF742 domain-containing protein [Nonomuraea phyllanthi]|uniref:DUF742 domain-containing protein n=1 Tax=Nonomuraea phyllanthi TaxID=2219224 RepID=UPI0012934DD6|nr:DUF742 domain-containing protein [Nonomuraea phyllanthi]QFY07772.1 DUF742 domain-containing protein [Nonomuraea phyllanthi]